MAESALERKLKTFYFPLGLLYLAGAARDVGHDVAVFDGTFESGDEAFIQRLDTYHPDVVCIGSWITVRPTALRLVRLAKQRGSHIILGGPDPTLHPEIYLKDPAVDIVVLGEGELTLVDLLPKLAAGETLTQVSGIALGGTEGVVTTGNRKRIANLDRLPLPARDLIDVNRYLETWEKSQGYRSLTLSVSRGCADENCEFCINSTMGKHLRRSSHEHVVAEMKMLEDTYAIERFRIVDDLDTIGREWLVMLGKAMIAAQITTPYEGLKPTKLDGLPMLGEVKDICADRNAWIPTQGSHPHAPPVEDEDLLKRRWGEAILLEGEHLEEP